LVLEFKKGVVKLLAPPTADPPVLASYQLGIPRLDSAYNSTIPGPHLSAGTTFVTNGVGITSSSIGAVYSVLQTPFLTEAL
jgi:hypothetical protein